ncbi:MAG TPA: peptidylprolyl isomerase [Myxococcales bacterium]|nr:peptidylprolyl isomerase [Myxococcales bacterium]
MINLLALILATTAAASPFRVRLDTTRGPIVIEVVPAWAPRAAARFRELVSSGYYDDTRFFRVVKGRWAQFGISGDPALAKKRRAETFPDEAAGPRRSNLRGTVAFAFAVADGRSTQVFVNLADNRKLDAQGFAPFGRVVQGMENVDALYGGYGEASGGGIRAGRQQPLFEGGNAWLDARFPRLDRILRARVLP